MSAQYVIAVPVEARLGKAEPSRVMLMFPSACRSLDVNSAVAALIASLA